MWNKRFMSGFITTLVFCSLLFLVSCNGDEDAVKIDSTGLIVPASNDIIMVDNFPVIDGSDSTQPLRALLACKLLNMDYTWWLHYLYMTWSIVPQEWLNSGGRWDTWKKLEEKKLYNSNTHGSFMKCIDGENELIITARGISRDEQKYAEEKGVKLISRPIAKDAFIFMVNKDNPVSNLTIKQIQDIYMGEITNWKEVGGNDTIIIPFVRNVNSGSQEKMETIVMKGLTMPDWSPFVLSDMTDPFANLRKYNNGISYTPMYYYSYIIRSIHTKMLSVNGITANKETIINGTYPYITDVIASVRSDIEKTSTAYQLFYKLVTGQYDDIIEESGYISNRNFVNK